MRKMSAAPPMALSTLSRRLRSSGRQAQSLKTGEMTANRGRSPLSFSDVPAKEDDSSGSEIEAMVLVACGWLALDVGNATVLDRQSHVVVYPLLLAAGTVS